MDRVSIGGSNPQTVVPTVRTRLGNLAMGGAKDGLRYLPFPKQRYGFSRREYILWLDQYAEGTALTLVTPARLDVIVFPTTHVGYSYRGISNESVDIAGHIIDAIRRAILGAVVGELRHR